MRLATATEIFNTCSRKLPNSALRVATASVWASDCILAAVLTRFLLDRGGNIFATTARLVDHLLRFGARLRQDLVGFGFGIFPRPGRSSRVFQAFGDAIAPFVEDIHQADRR